MNARVFVNLLIIGVLIISFGINPIEYFFITRHFAREKTESMFYKTSRYTKFLYFYPFSRYPMFSWVYAPTYVGVFEIRGIYGEFEIELPIKEYFYPFWQRGMIESFANHEAAGTSRHTFIKGLLKLYHARLKAHQYPAASKDIDGIRVYFSRLPLQDWITFQQNNSYIYGELEPRLRSTYVYEIKNDDM